MIKGKVTTRPATAEEVRMFYPDGLKQSIRAWVGVCQDTIIGMGGYLMTPNGHTCLLYPRRDISISKRAIWEGIKKVFFDNILPSTQAQLNAIQDKTECNSEKLLYMLGFDKVYKTKEGEQVFIYYGER